MPACPRCGAPRGDSPAGADDLCPSCLLQLALRESTFDTPPGDHAETVEPDAPSPYRIVSVLGTGQSGSTYLAESAAAVGARRHVAMTLCDVEVASPQAVADLRAVVARIAAVHHPAFARLLDAGIGEGRRPFFVFEFVRGVPIVMHCQRSRLALVDRLALVADVKAALDVAHAAGVIHGALSASNVLVAGTASAASIRILQLGEHAALARLTAGAVPAPTEDDDRRALDALRQLLVSGV